MVKRKAFWGLLVAILLGSLPNYQALAHVCDDVLRHDPIVIWPEKDTVRVTNTGQFKIFLRNGWTDSIHQVRLIVPSSPFEISVSPASIERIPPQEQDSFLVSLTIPRKIEPGLHLLTIKVNAREFAIDREVNLKIQVERPARSPEPVSREPTATIEIVPSDILVAMSAFPDVLETEPGTLAKFKVFVRSGHNDFLRGLVLTVCAEGFEVLDVTPSVIKELGPGQINSFEVTLAIPKEAKEGDYLVQVNLKAQELPVDRGTYLFIRIKKVNQWLPYLYVFAIVSLLGLLIWRWQRTTRQRAKPPPAR